MTGHEKLKWCAVFVCIISAIVMAFFALYIVPVGVISESVLFFTAQLLVFAGSCIGINVINISSIKRAFNGKESKNTPSK